MYFYIWISIFLKFDTQIKNGLKKTESDFLDGKRNTMQGSDTFFIKIDSAEIK